jgi:hypothetical protein
VEQIHNSANVGLLFSVMKKILINKVEQKIERVYPDIGLGKTLPGLKVLIAHAHSLIEQKNIEVANSKQSALYKCNTTICLSTDCPLLQNKNTRNFPSFHKLLSATQIFIQKRPNVRCDLFFTLDKKWSKHEKSQRSVGASLRFVC